MSDPAGSTHTSADRLADTIAGLHLTTTIIVGAVLRELAQVSPAHADAIRRGLDAAEREAVDHESERVRAMVPLRVAEIRDDLPA